MGLMKLRGVSTPRSEMSWLSETYIITHWCGFFLGLSKISYICGVMNANLYGNLGTNNNTYRNTQR